jgi:SAM-dependent methyltransferase
MLTSTEIKHYWNARANEDPQNATTDDFYLRQLEQQTLANKIQALQPRSILDIGCGDAKTTIELAVQFPDVHFAGMDFSAEMLELAARKLEIMGYSGKSVNNLTLFEGDACETWPDADIVISCRCLINLPKDQQDMALEQAALRPVALIENFIEPHEHLNELRKGAFLPPIPVREHNLYLSADRVASTESFADTYYFATRVIYARTCQAKEVKPDYRSLEHRLAWTLPNVTALFCAPMRLICKPPLEI